MAEGYKGGVGAADATTRARGAEVAATSSAGRLLDPAETTAAQMRLGLIVEASARMARTLDLGAVARGLVDTVVPAFADEASLDLTEELFRPQHVGTQRRIPLMCRVACADHLTGTPSAPREEWLSYGSGTPALEALESGDPRIAAGDAASGSQLFVPLVARGRVLGLARFDRRPGQSPYGDADLALAEELALRAALALDNVRLYDEARATAVALQRSLLPEVHPQLTGVTTAHRYLPGSRDTEVGGDWFDVMPLSSGRVAFVIGDVMGRGLRAAAAMGQLRTAVRMLAVLDPMPDDVLSHLDDLALSTSQVQLATCVYAVFDPVSRELCFATAGHMPPVVQEPDGKARFLEQPSGAPLGVGGVAYEASTVTIPDGSRLLLYTDGLVEARGSDIDEGLDALIVALATAPDGLEELCEHLLSTLGRDTAHDDDVALLVARLNGLEDTRVECWQLSAESWQVAVVRARVRETLARWGLHQLADSAELVVSELVTNAVRHATGPIEVQVLLLDQIVSFSVGDAKTPLPRLRRTSFDDEGGRGLQLVSLLGHRWGARATPTGKVVWCDLLRPPPAASAGT